MAELELSPLARVAYWLDHNGGLLGPGPATNPTGWDKYGQQTHRIMRSSASMPIQAVSWCGHRVHEVPGRGDVDCPACLELIAEDKS